MTERDVQMFAIYNAEKARGIAHTEEWHARMRLVQAEFDARSIASNHQPMADPYKEGEAGT